MFSPHDAAGGEILGGYDRTVATHLFSSRKALFRTIAAGVAGALLGIVISLIVNVALVEISLSPFFALYFGILFVAVGGLIIWRVLSGQSPDPDENHQKQLIGFALAVILSGIVCFFLERSWFVQSSWLFKVPIYSLLGVSVAFALTFTIVDIVNLLVGAFQTSAAKPIVNSPSQVRLVIMLAIAMGAIFGAMFGFMSVEEEVSYHIKLALMREEHYCYPIGAILGAVAGVGNEYMKLRADTWSRLEQNEFDDDI